MNRRTDWPPVIISLLMVAGLVACTIIIPAETTAALENARIAVCETLGVYFLLLVIACIAFCAWAALSKYGGVRMGREKPQYKNFAWLSMIFCAATGVSILYWSALEWAYYVQTPPFGLSPLSVEAFEIALPYSFFHWGIPPWSVYAAGVIPLAYRCHVRKKNDMTLQAACEGAIGERLAAGWLGRVINVVFVFGIVGGLVITYGTSIPMLANNLRNVFGTGETFAVYAILIAVVTAVFAGGTCAGLDKGMQYVSQGAAYSSILLCLLFLVLGYPLFALENTFQSLGTMIDRFFPMLTNLDAVSGGTFTRDWTVFYWAWWVCLAPWMWIFIARISKGRSIRAIVGAVVLAGTAGTVLFFGTISNYGIKAYLNGALNAVEIMKSAGANQVISELSLSLPGGKAILLLWFITAFAMLVTTMSSATYSLSSATTRGLLPGEDPTRRMRLFWALLLAIAPLCLMYAGEFTGGISLSGLQATLILVAVPVSVTVVLSMISGVRWLKEDFGDKSRAEIAAAFMPEEGGAA